MRAQAYTLEGVVAAMLLISGVVFALQVTAVTPLSASTSNQHIEKQLSGDARGLLASAEKAGALERAVLFWNESGLRFHGATGMQYYTNAGPPNEFGRMLDESLRGEGIAFNVYVSYVTKSSTRDRQRMVYFGQPSDNAATARWQVTIHDDTTLVDANGQATSTNVSETDTFYAPDAAPSSSVYNVLEVEVVVWRM